MPKKSLGQNFLRDENILKKIVSSARIQTEDVVLEIGPGEGTLTKFLLEKAKKVVSIEKDSELSLKLEEKFKSEINEGKFKIKNADALKIENVFDFQDFKINDYILVGNIPYYITGEIFRKFLQNPPFNKQPKSITFIIQKEVAERIMARDSKESILSISIKVYGKPEIGGIIKAGSFFPAPKVDSEIISIRNISKERFNTQPTEKRFFEILKAGFAHKRKFLIKNLENIADKEKLKDIFKHLNMSEKARAEDLKTEDWLNLTKEIL